MVDLAKRPKKHVKEIRVRAYPDNDFSAPNLEQVGMRYAFLLAEKFDYKLSACDCILLMRSERESQEFRLTGPIRQVSTSIFYVCVRFEMEKLAADYYAYTVDLISRILKEIAVIEGVDSQPIELAKSVMMTEREDTLIPWTSRRIQSSKYLIEPSVKMKGMGAYSALLYVKLTELASGRTATRLVLQAPLYEVKDLARRFSVRKNELVLSHKKSHLTEGYRQRGFSVPVVIPLDKFDWYKP